MDIKDPENSSTLSTHFWKELENGNEPKVTWSILEANISDFNPVRKECRLCLREKFNIAFKPQLATLNSRNEIFAHCRHKKFKLIGEPPG